ncbi:MAG: glycosyltransferase family 39 protein [Flavobacteriales bacterium]|nr:glycosyltransferase family 39 protein [Flavobacteriales bacterium]
MARKKQIRKEQKVAAVSETGTKEEFILNKIDWFWVGTFLVVGLSVLIRINFLEIPFERDEGTYTYYAQLQLDGKNLYTSFDAMKFPGIYYAYAVIIAIFGATIQGVHLGFLILNVITTFWLIRSAKILFDKNTALIVGLSYVVLSMAPNLSGFTVQSEHLIAFFLAGSLLYSLKAIESQKLYLFFISGLLVGASIMIKQSAVFYILFIGIYFLVESFVNKAIDWPQRMRQLGMYSVGVFTFFVLGLIVVKAQGVWDDFVFWTMEYPKSYASQIKWEQGKQLLSMTFDRIILNYEVFWILSGLGLVAVLFLKNVPIRTKVFYWLFAIFAFLTVVPGFRFYGHYWIQLVPALAIFIGLAFYSITELIRARIKIDKIKIVGLVIFVLIISSHLSSQRDYYFKPDHTQILRKVYGLNPFPEAKVIGDYIKSRTQEGDEIVVLGSEPQIHFYSGRRSPSKHSYMAHLVGLHEDHRIWQKEFFQTIENAMPEYLVFFDHSVSWLVQQGADQTIFSWYNKFATENYKLVGIADMISPTQTVYVWDNNVNNYQPKGQYKIFTFKLNKPRNIEGQ